MGHVKCTVLDSKGIKKVKECKGTDLRSRPIQVSGWTGYVYGLEDWYKLFLGVSEEISRTRRDSDDTTD